MAQPSHFFHLHISKKQELSALDRAATIIAFLYPMTGIPQLLSVIDGNAEGVSLISWIGFGLSSMFFLTYGLIHKVRPMIITNSMWLVIDILIVGALIVNDMIA